MDGFTLTTRIAQIIRSGQFPGIVFQPDGDPPEQHPSPNPTPATESPDPNKPPAEDPKWLDVRLKRAEEKAREKLLKELGITDPAELEKQRARLKELEDEKLTNEERLTKEAADAKVEAANYKAIAEREAEERKTDKQKQTVREAAVAAGMGAEYLDLALPSAVQGLVEKFGSLEKVTAEQQQAYFTELKTSKPGLFTPAPVPVTTSTDANNQNPAGKTPPPVDVRDMSPQQYRDHKNRMGIH